MPGTQSKNSPVSSPLICLAPSPSQARAQANFDRPIDRAKSLSSSSTRFEKRSDALHLLLPLPLHGSHSSLQFLDAGWQGFACRRSDLVASLLLAGDLGAELRNHRHTSLDPNSTPWVWSTSMASSGEESTTRLRCPMRRRRSIFGERWCGVGGCTERRRRRVLGSERRRRSEKKNIKN